MSDSGSDPTASTRDARRRPSVRSLEPEVRSDAGAMMTGLADQQYLKTAQSRGLLAPYVVVWQFNARPGMERDLVNWLEEHEWKFFDTSALEPPKGIRYCGCLRACFGHREAWAGEFRILWHVESWEDIQNFKNAGHGSSQAFVDLISALEEAIEVVGTQIYQPAAKT